MTSFIFLAASLYAIIGGPSVGKTSIIEELKAKGEQTIEEAATVIIKQNLDKGVKAPWENDGFQTDIFNLKLKLENRAQGSNDDFFVDRGLLDDLVYLEINGRKNTNEYKTINDTIASLDIGKRYTAIFYIEPHNCDKFSCKVSEIRCEDTKEALKVGKAIKQIYSKYYNIITIPGNLSVKQRTTLIVDKIKKLRNKN